MSEWWTYSFSDFLMFSPSTYYRLFELYNAAIWPAQLLAFATGVAILALLHRPGDWPGRVVAAILAACWLWVAWAYFFLRYSTISLAGNYFAMGFAAQALLIAWIGIVRSRLRFQGPAAPIKFRIKFDGTFVLGTAGLCIFLYALVVHPLIGPLTGRPWLQAEIFGVAPDPTVVATLGILVTARRPHWELLVIPLLWCAVSGATLWTMQSPEAPVLPAIGVVALVLTAWKSLRSGGSTSSLEPEDLRSSMSR
jgi:hypothetical protein